MKKLTLLGMFLLVLILFPVSVHLSYGQEDPKVEWVARYDGPDNGRDSATGIVVDPAGNVYVTGDSVGDGTSGDCTTIKYDRYGNELWVARYNGPANVRSYTGRGIAVDSSGNVYVTRGTVKAFGGLFSDFVTIKYDKDGNQLWVATYDGPGNGWDGPSYFNSIAVDPAGNVYVTGACDGVEAGSEDQDYATIKYDKHGNELWVAFYNGPLELLDMAQAIAVDPAGNVYVTGLTDSYLFEGHYHGDFATIKYDKDGNQLWVATYDGPEDYEDIARAIAVDPLGNVYVTGTTDMHYGMGVGTNEDYATIKYDKDGNQLWVATYDGPVNGNDECHAIAVDPAGNVYVTGESDGGLTATDYATVKYDKHGSQLWFARYNGPGNGWDAPSYFNAVAVDPAGNVYVTGESDGGLTATDYATIKYDRYGNELWVATYDGPGNTDDGASAIAVDPSGNVYVTGYSYGIETGADYATIKYSK